MKLVLPLMAALAFISLGQSDQVTPKNGSPLTGKVVQVDRDGVEIEPTGGTKQRIVWADITNLSTAQAVKVKLQNGDQLTVTIRGLAADHLSADFPPVGAVQLPIASLEAAPPPPKQDVPPDPNKPPITPGDWKGKVALSGTVRKGNVDSVLGALHAEVERSWDADKLTAAGDALYGKTDGNLTASSFGGRVRLDHFYNSSLYTYGSAEALHDEIQNIDVRAILSIGVGDVFWHESDDRLWSVEGGISGLYEEGAGRSSSTSPAGRAATTYKDVFFTDLHFEQNIELLVPFDDPGRFLAKSRTLFTVPISTSIRMRTSLELNYQGSPAPNTEKLDILGLVGLEYQF